jgi:hypothetical protein
VDGVYPPDPAHIESCSTRRACRPAHRRPAHARAVRAGTLALHPNRPTRHPRRDVVRSFEPVAAAAQVELGAASTATCRSSTSIRFGSGRLANLVANAIRHAAGRHAVTLAGSVERTPLGPARGDRYRRASTRAAAPCLRSLRQGRGSRVRGWGWPSRQLVLAHGARSPPSHRPTRDDDAVRLPLTGG